MSMKSFERFNKKNNIFFKSCITGDPTAPDLGGWRARLARQGYVASTVRKKTVLVPERRWQYLDEDELEETTEEFEYRTSRATCEDCHDKLNSVISRTMRMKLEPMVAKMSTAEVEIQVRTKKIISEVILYKNK